MSKKWTKNSLLVKPKDFRVYVCSAQLGDYEFWSTPVDGSTSTTLLNPIDIHPYEDMVSMTNPPTGWLQNSNEPPWSYTFPVSDPDQYPNYFTEVSAFRARTV